MIPYGRQEITDNDILEVEKVLRSDFLTQGPIVPKFEKSVADYCGASNAIAVNSATSALHIACLALDLGPGDWMWTSPNTFVATANCGLYCGANVDFVDIDLNTYNMSVKALTDKLAEAEKSGLLPKIVIPVHLAGQPCDMIAIYELSKKYGFKIIEDASHAIGASYNLTKVGSCSHSDIAIFSFHPVKIITTGEGGMALTNDEMIANRLTHLRNSGNTRNKIFMQPRPENEIWNYQQIELGFNYRMTDIQAALGLSQLKRLDKFISRRREIAKHYDKAFDCLPIKVPVQLKGTLSSYHLYPICIEENKNEITQKEIYNILWKNKISVSLHYIPVYLQPYYQSLNFKRGYCPNAESYFKSALSIPIYVGLSLENQNKVINIISNSFLEYKQE
ncbi:UDP-4-amino-4,6-dideoxy-N-acetyl-beta-L-altrosamine transaminase [Candidatus Pelagibacter sp.]|nr:UDP-4-amino-4,6-dideoxy-N-acetyl-beta-L-altrosamine transaminase [Candidatus Pelagibacter sp.]